MIVFELDAAPVNFSPSCFLVFIVFEVATRVNCPILDAPLLTYLFWSQIKTSLRSDTACIVLLDSELASKEQNCRDEIQLFAVYVVFEYDKPPQFKAFSSVYF